MHHFPGGRGVCRRIFGARVTAYPYVLRWRIARTSNTRGLPAATVARWLASVGGERKGQVCRVLARALVMGTVLVEFEDGFRLTCSWRALRKKDG